MWPFKSVSRPQPKRVAELEAELDDVQVTISWLRKSVKDLNGRLSTLQRQQKPLEVASEDTNGDEVAPQYPPFQPRTFESTAHLARRFRGI